MTAAGPETVRARLRRNRAVLLLGALLLLVLAVAALVAGGRAGYPLDPDGYDPEGAHALAVLLEQQGVEVRRTTDVPATLAAATTASTVFVPLPELLSPEELEALVNVPGQLVVARADPDRLALLGISTETVGGAGTEVRDPGCDVPWVTNAGRAHAGEWEYDATQVGDTTCYDGSLLVQRDAAVLGSGEPLTNDRLDEQGNAALGVGLLGREPLLVWLVPVPNRPALGERPALSPDDLLPGWVTDARWYLLAVVGVTLVLWRGRRLGRVVTEPLPVVVRASETVEGHGRLYHAAGARGTAAEALRAAAVRRLEPLAHGGRNLPAEDVVATAAARTGRPDVQVRHLLYGPAPADDAALVRLADDLDALVRDALHREGAGS